MNKRLNESERQELIRIFDENGYDVTDIEKLTFELEKQGSTYIGDRKDIMDQWCDLMCITFSREFLDEDYIIRNDEDWEELSHNRFFNTYRMFEDWNGELKRLELKLNCIKQQ